MVFSDSSPSPSPVSDGGGVAEDHGGHHQLAAEVPKKRTGRRVFRETRHPVYRGVRSRKGGDRWVCELREPNTGTRVWLGTYPTADMAARAHDVAALAFRGKSACLNFADSAWRLPVPASIGATDIRRAAAEAAEMFRPEERRPLPSPSPPAALSSYGVLEESDEWGYLESYNIITDHDWSLWDN